MTEKRRKPRAEKRATAFVPPEFCTYQCPAGDFPPADTAGLCRTMAAVYCKKLKRLVNKNGPCRWQS